MEYTVREMGQTGKEKMRYGKKCGLLLRYRRAPE
jgi:hypothetical protein